MIRFCIIVGLLLGGMGCSQPGVILLERIEPSATMLTGRCLEQSIGYYQRFGYSVSKYFVFTHVEAKDLNGDGIADSIAILSPLELLPDYEICHKTKLEKVENRLLLVNINNINGSVSQKYRFDNVVSNEPTSRIKSGSEYIDVTLDNSGFVLYQDFGQGCYAQYYIYIHYLGNENQLEIGSIVFKTYCPGIDSLEQIEEYLFESHLFFLKDYDREFVTPFKRKFGVVE
jgi:hypothetical protein